MTTFYKIVFCFLINRAIFPRDLIHDIRIKRFEFIREKFFQKSRREKQRALFWLQVTCSLLNHTHSCHTPYRTCLVCLFLSLIPLIFLKALYIHTGNHYDVKDQKRMKKKTQCQCYESGCGYMSSNYSCNYVLTTPLSLCYRESSGSISGYDSESGLVSQTSMDVHAIIQHNSALPRYILMLDIWFSQV